MIETECALGSCKKPLKIAEQDKNEDALDEFWMIIFSYHTYFFCSPEHCEEYAE